MEEALKAAKKFLLAYLKDRHCEYEQVHPWRKPWEFVVLHSLRVENYVQKLLKTEHLAASQEEIALVRMAAVLHDVGRIHQRQDHALISRDIVSTWLHEAEPSSLKGIDTGRLLQLIEKHSHKEEQDEDLCSRILKDADILDEIGVISIFMASSWIERSNPYFFSLLKDRVETRELDFCDKMAALLNTEGAKVILKQRKGFIEQFCGQLEEELGGTGPFGVMTLEDSFR